MQLIFWISLPRGLEAMKETSVHLAQLKYMLPRLAGQGIMLSRQAGELVAVDLVKVNWANRRSIRNQIADIERQ